MLMAASSPPCPMLIRGQSLEYNEFINRVFWTCADSRLSGLTQGEYNSILEGLRGVIATVLARGPLLSEWDAWPDGGSEPAVPKFRPIDWAPAAPPSSPMSAPARPPHLSQRQVDVADPHATDISPHHLPDFEALISPPLMPPPKRRKTYQADGGGCRPQLRRHR